MITQGQPFPYKITKTLNQVNIFISLLNLRFLAARLLLIQRPEMRNIPFLLSKFRFVTLFLSLFFSSQELKKEKFLDNEPTFAVMTGASVYSTDTDFNKQISKNKSLQQYAVIIASDDGTELKIISKTTVISKKRKKAGVRKKSIKTIDRTIAPKPQTYPASDAQICTPSRDHFAQLHAVETGFCLVTVHDFNLISSVSISVETMSISCPPVMVCDYFYTNDNSRLQMASLCLSVRPPPGN